MLIPLGQERQGIGTMDPGQFAAGRCRITTGLTMTGGIPVQHDFNAWLPEAPDAPNDRACQHCGASISHLKASAKHCGPACKQAVYRARVTETDHGMPFGMPHEMSTGCPT
jgi:hypothetical protein